MPSIPLPIGQFPSSKDVIARASELAAAAQKIYDAWDQDADGMDPELGEGGICQDVASALIEALGEMGVSETVTVHSTIGDNHVWCTALLSDGAFAIDVPASVYETGSGYSWRKIPGITIEAADVTLLRLGDPIDPDDFAVTYGGD